MKMTIDLPKDFAGESRVWIYQSNRLFTESESATIKNLLADFVRSWNSHGAQVKGFADIFFDRFIILMADEHATGVSGCSTDSSVRLIKEIESRCQVNLFDRQALTFIRNEKIEDLPLSQLGYAVENNFIRPDTLFFDNTIGSKSALEANWPGAAGSSWLARRFPLLSPSGQNSPT